MLSLTLRVIQGADRGKVFADLRPPLTIGREEGNSIQLNDERVSRFHVKIQEDNNHLVLTDLDSTNGTKVNGQDCQLRILRYGDIVSIGRSVLLYGTREQIASRIQQAPEAATAGNQADLQMSLDHLDEADFDFSTGMMSSFRLLASQSTSPGLPDRLSPSQSAQLSEILDYLHLRLSVVIDSARGNEEGNDIRIDGVTWQVMLHLQSRISELIRKLADPEHNITD